MSNPLIVGTLAIDTIDLSGRRIAESFGGSASFAAVAASFFGPVRLVCVVGEDFPPEFRSLLCDRGVDLSAVVTQAGGKMFRWHGHYQEDLNCRHTVELQLNVIEHFEPVIPEPFRDSRPVMLANMPPARQLKALEQLGPSRFVLLDTVDDWIIAHREELIHVLGHIDIALMNEAEARLLTGEGNLVRAGRAIRKLGPPIVILKKGEHGVLLIDEHGVTALPASPTDDVRDPTGAGDSFAGGILGYLATLPETTPIALRTAIAYGNVLASFTVEGDGLDRLRRLTRAEIDERFVQYSRMLHFAGM